jgi:hypothetical protein
MRRCADPLKDGLPLERSAPLDDSALAAHSAAVVNQARRPCAHARVESTHA